MVVSIKRKFIKGVTLVEMILYVAICSFLLLALSSMFSYLLESRIKSQAISEVNQQGFLVMHLLTTNIRNAKSIDSPPTGTASSSLSMTAQTPVVSPTIFRSVGSALFMNEGAISSLPITNSRVTISTLLFQNISSASSTDKIVRFSYTLSYNSSSTRQEYSYSKAFSGSATLRQ